MSETQWLIIKLFMLCVLRYVVTGGYDSKEVDRLVYGIQKDTK